MTQNATQAKKSRSFTVGVSFRLSPYYSLGAARKCFGPSYFVTALELFQEWVDLGKHQIQA